jgi:LytS/YehU family sensor histidine kinase
MMDWIIHNLQLLATLGSALAVYVFIRAGARRDVSALAEEFRKEFKDMKQDIKEVRVEMCHINDRLTRLEVRFEERTFRVIHVDRTGTEEKK